MRTVMLRKQTFVAASILLGSVAVVAACGDDPTTTIEGATPERLVIVSHESFTPPDGAFDAFTAATGITVGIAAAGDAGELVARAVLTAGNPEGDVMWGVDNTLLARAIAGDVFEPYESTAHPVRDDLAGSGDGVVTPVDSGEVCVNFDEAALTDLGLQPPTSLDDLVDPAYRGLLVVSSPETSSPGLAFLLATIAEYGDGWTDYWERLVANDVLVVSGWSDAYYAEFTRHGGDRPLVLSYATSPPAEVIFADPPLADDAPAPTGAMTSGCFRQIEYAGVLRGGDHLEAARLLVDYLVDPTFQALVPESLFVLPATTDVELPESFRRHAAIVDTPLTIPPDRIEAERENWIDEWRRIVL